MDGKECTDGSYFWNPNAAGDNLIRSQAPSAKMIPTAIA